MVAGRLAAAPVAKASLGAASYYFVVGRICAGMRVW